MKIKNKFYTFTCVISFIGLILININCGSKDDSGKGDYVVIDDFESYYDSEPGTVFNFWVDGIESNDVNNGSWIGHPSEPYMELEVVHSGMKSVPFDYYFENYTYSEVSIKSEDLEIGYDWSIYSPKYLTLWFHGCLENIPARMYVKINDSKVYYSGQENDLTKSKWKRWDTEITKFDIDFSNVKTFSIGFEESEEHPDALGQILFDDIRLYKSLK
ncbi:MAG: hypothetical protein JXA96_07535 [Sedimentisphaerales bacterium]|nr:hypothetical protein [Sedimentisphaerales bacterium]